MINTQTVLVGILIIALSVAGMTIVDVVCDRIERKHED